MVLDHITLYMKTSRLIWLVAISFALPVTVFGQDFQNLYFEQATIASAPANYTPSDAYNPISAASALPYWTVMEDNTICTAVWGTPNAIDETSVALVSAASGASPILGSYSVMLSAYADASAGYFHSSSISQTGLIPVGTRSLQFSIASAPQAGAVQASPAVTLNGTPIALQELYEANGVIEMAGNISAFANSTATLTFECQATPGGGFPANENYYYLDNIQFSPQDVPEPGALALLGMGLVLFVRRFTKTA